MKPVWKYTVGLLIELVIKILQTVIDSDNTVIPGTGSKTVKKG